MVLPERATDSIGLMLHREMLVAAGGRERTAASTWTCCQELVFGSSPVIDTALISPDLYVGIEADTHVD